MDLIARKSEKSRLKRMPRWLGWALVAIIPISCTVLGLLAIDVAGTRRWRAVLAEARQQGTPLTLEEVEAKRRVWPDEANGARVIEASFQELNDIRKGEALKSSLACVPWVGAGYEPKLGRRWSADQAAAAAELIERLSGTLAKIDRLIEYEGGRFAINHPTPPDRASLAHLDPLRTALEMKSLQTFARIVDGRTDSVIHDVTVLARHGQLLADEPSLTSGMVACSCDVQTVDMIERICALTTLDPDQLVALEDVLAGMEQPMRLYWGLLGERAMFVDMLVALGQLDLGGHGGTAVEGAPNASEQQVGSSLVNLFRKDQTTCLCMYNRLVFAASDRQAMVKALAQNSQGLAAISRHETIAHAFAPSFARACDRHTQTTAVLRCARVGLAAERYRVKEGRFPARLEDLMPRYLAAVPVDPFDDHPLRCRVDRDRIVIYSIGTDGLDDGGQVWPCSFVKAGPDVGFVLLRPHLRNLPPAENSSTQASTASEALKTTETGR